VRVEFHWLFQADLENAARYYLLNGGQELAQQFIDEVEQSVFRITENPLAYSRTFKDVRRLRLKRFKAYIIRYSFDEATETIFVASLLHSARHPDADKDRF
jgi:plasmid stabilization system protein ParE